MNGYLDTLSGDLRRDAPEPARGFLDALSAGPHVTVIAEVKRASPSAGAIAPDADVATTARAYAEGGAAAMSVLCAARDFGGSLADLNAARAVSPLPALAKDFTVFPQHRCRPAVGRSGRHPGHPGPRHRRRGGAAPGDS